MSDQPIDGEKEIEIYFAVDMENGRVVMKFDRERMSLSLTFSEALEVSSRFLLGAIALREEFISKTKEMAREKQDDPARESKQIGKPPEGGQESQDEGAWESPKRDVSARTDISAAASEGVKEEEADPNYDS